jgi:uncharacterized heparinase superfamily protein
LEKRFRDPVKVLARVPAWTLARESSRLRLPDPVPPQDAEALAKGMFTFIGQTGSLGTPSDWMASGKPRLWQYNLHYFDWLWSLLPENEPVWENAKRLTLDWVERHPVGRNACGWEPYPTSLRLINWALLFGIRHRLRVEEDEAFKGALLGSIARQTLWLEHNLETHIQANHLLENLVALACVASVFDGPGRVRLEGRIFPLLKREVHEQILPDGMHYERSPMYHLRILWLMEMLGEVGSPPIRELVQEPLERMRAAHQCLLHPDGDIAQFNDAAIGIYHDAWPRDFQFGPWALPDAGYYGYRRENGDYLIVDAGAIGPDYQPGHAHADLLSLELSIGGRRFITDTGIGTYDTGAVRSFDRSTAAHNTVEIDGESSVEVWGGFRVGRRATPEVITWDAANEGSFLDAKHAGYHHLPCRAIHRRSFGWEGENRLTITDTITVRDQAEWTNRFHLAPGVSAGITDRKVVCRHGDSSVILEVKGPGQISIETAIAHPTFGANAERLVVVIRHVAVPPQDQVCVNIRW